MEQQNKRFKTTKESIVSDIATSISSISESLKSIADSHGTLIKTNKVIVSYLQETEKAEKAAKIIKTDLAADEEQ